MAINKAGMHTGIVPFSEEDEKVVCLFVCCCCFYFLCLDIR